MSYLQRLRQGEFSHKHPQDMLTKLTEGGEPASPTPARQGDFSKKAPIRVADKADKKAFDSSVSHQPEHIALRRIWSYLIDGRAARLIDPHGAPRSVVQQEILSRYGAHRVSNLRLHQPPASPSKEATQ